MLLDWLLKRWDFFCTEKRWIAKVQESLREFFSSSKWPPSESLLRIEKCIVIFMWFRSPINFQNYYLMYVFSWSLYSIISIHSVLFYLMIYQSKSKPIKFTDDSNVNALPSMSFFSYFFIHSLICCHSLSVSLPLLSHIILSHLLLFFLASSFLLQSSITEQKEHKISIRLLE